MDQRKSFQSSELAWGKVLPLYHRSEAMGSLTWLCPVLATHIDSGLPPLPTVHKQHLLSAGCKSNKNNLFFRFHVYSISLACCIWMGGYEGLLTWIGMILSWFWKSYFSSCHGYWSLHSFGATLPAGPGSAPFQFLLLLLSIWQEEEGSFTLIQDCCSCYWKSGVCFWWVGIAAICQMLQSWR